MGSGDKEYIRSDSQTVSRVYWFLYIVGEADLSRRKLEYRMVGLSFCEYLAISYGYHLPVYSLEDILKHKVDFPYVEARPILLFKEYLQHGYYPFFQEKGYLLRLQSIIKQTLENDIPTFANMNIATALKLKRLLYIIAKSVPLNLILPSWRLCLI